MAPVCYECLAAVRLALREVLTPAQTDEIKKDIAHMPHHPHCPVCGDTSGIFAKPDAVPATPSSFTTADVQLVIEGVQRRDILTPTQTDEV